ncbi:MAG: pyridoxamine 5'-phosphate oxidase family protein [Holdemanella sp.]|nr:pyridoxamine 5'-phosphate oxidase family protein [Holdemanella sp.]
MFREMRRNAQQLSFKENEEILKRNQSAVLGVQTENGYPYTVPINYYYEYPYIYFHCANKGYKLESIKKNSKVSLCIIDQDEIYAEKLATNYKSVILFGKAVLLEDKKEALLKFGRKYSHDIELIDKDIMESWNRVVCIRIQIEHMTGKKGIYVE